MQSNKLVYTTMYNINPHMINLCNFGTKKNSINWNGEIIVL